MATSDTEIANLALLNLGQTKTISALTERSTEARVLTQFYETARDATLRDHPWPFATKFATLALVETDPTTEWKYSYRYPNDCLQMRRMFSGARQDTRQSQIPFRTGRDAAGELIYTDLEEAKCEYGIRITDPSKFPADFVLALAWRLAMYAAAGITGGDPFKLGDRAAKLYAFEISRAFANIENQQSNDAPNEAESIRARS